MSAGDRDLARCLMARRSEHPDDGRLGEHFWTVGWWMVRDGIRRWASGEIMTVGSVTDGMRIKYRADRQGG